MAKAGRAGIAQQPLQPLAVVRLDAHGCVQREGCAVIPGPHRLGILALEQAAPGKRAQNPPAQLRLDFVDHPPG